MSDKPLFPTKALSVRQPWTWAILHAGKDVENRSAAALRHMRIDPFSSIALHASKGMTRDEYEDCLDDCHAISRKQPFPSGLTLPPFDDLPRGGIVGIAQLYDAVTEHESLWFSGRIGLVLRNAKSLPFVPLKGMLGFFDVADHLVAKAA